MLDSEQASLQLHIHSANIRALHTEPTLSCQCVRCPQWARITGRPFSVCSALSPAQGPWTPHPTFFTGPHPPGWFEAADPWVPTPWMTFTGPPLYPGQRCFLTFPCCLVLPPNSQIHPLGTKPPPELLWGCSSAPSPPFSLSLPTFRVILFPLHPPTSERFDSFPNSGRLPKKGGKIF